VFTYTSVEDMESAKLVVTPEDIEEWEESYIGSDDYLDNWAEFMAYAQDGTPSDEQAFQESDWYFDARHNYICDMKGI
jgi:hypothetical protein